MECNLVWNHIPVTSKSNEHVEREYDLKSQVRFSIKIAQNKVKLPRYYSGTPLIRSPRGQKKLALLTGCFFTRKCMVVLPSGSNNEVAIRRGSTVHPFWNHTGFLSILIFIYPLQETLLFLVKGEFGEQKLQPLPPTKDFFLPKRFCDLIG